MRDVEEMLAHCGVDVSDETVHAWTVIHRAALDRLGLLDRNRPGRLRESKRDENSHLSSGIR